MDFIQGELFPQVADFIYAPQIKKADDYDKTACTVDWNELKDVNVIYTHTMYVAKLLYIIKHFKQKFIIVSHNSDCRIEKRGVVTTKGDNLMKSVEPCPIPNNVIKWYSTNVNMVHPKLVPIPIGVENQRWQGNPTKKLQMIEKVNEPRDYKNLLYINHSIGTNVKQRKEPYELFEGKPWVTAVRGHNGVNFAGYIDDIYNHKFTICPEGNGIDTHRTWECLYVGSIPILKRHPNFRFYTDLPICFVDEWRGVTSTFLINEYRRISNATWNLEKLNFSYWNNKILSDVNSQ